MKITELSLPGVKLLEPVYHEDFRGYYVESYSSRTLREHGLDTVFVQDNHTFTRSRGVIRGIHFQNNPQAQAKLGRCTSGAVFDVAIDLRRDSPSFRKWVGVILSRENRRQLFIPAGFGHAVLTLTDDCEFVYKVSACYEPSLDRAIRWDDPELGIAWPIAPPIVSPKDAAAPFLKDSDVNF